MKTVTAAEANRQFSAVLRELAAGTAVLVTVGISNLVGRWLGHEDANWLLAPVAMVIGGVGHDWPGVLKTVQEKIMGLWGKRMDGGQS